MSGKIVQLYDGLAAAIGGLGSRNDKTAATYYTSQSIPITQLLAAYKSTWLARKIVDLPAMDATRQWRTWASDNEAMLAVEKKYRLREKLLEGLKAARLYGYAGIYVGATGSPQQPVQPTTRLKHLTVLMPHDLNVGEIEDDPTHANYGNPRYWNVGSVRVHPERIALLTGADTPGQITGESVLQAPYTAMKNADATAYNVASLTHEAKIDVFKIPELMASLADKDYEQKLMDRLRIANAGKSNVNALVMDAEEEYEQKQYNFGGLDQVVMAMYQVASGASGIPVTRLLGISPGGLNSRGDTEIRDYYDAVANTQESELTPTLAPLDDLLAREAGLQEAPSYDWNSLWQMSDSEKAQYFKEYTRGIKTLADSEVFTTQELHDPAVDALRNVKSGL